MHRSVPEKQRCDMAVLTVSQINRYMASRVREDGNLKHFMIKGEISNFKAHSSGHLYFSLKDEAGVIRAAMFRSSAQGLRFRPTDGMQVVAYGSVSLYPASGSYQLYVSHMERFGVGDLYLAYEELKKRIAISKPHAVRAKANEVLTW